jgi:hypothetical protein
MDQYDDNFIDARAGDHMVVGIHMNHVNVGVG